ncbi:unnamed protein product, partial [marine sediment metagenome]
ASIPIDCALKYSDSISTVPDPTKGSKTFGCFLGLDRSITDLTHCAENPAE